MFEISLHYPSPCIQASWSSDFLVLPIPPRQLQGNEIEVSAEPTVTLLLQARPPDPTRRR